MNYLEINEQAARILDESADDVGKTIDELIKTSWGGSNESQAKAIQLLKGLAFSDDPRSNQFMKKLDGFTSKMSAKLDGAKTEAMGVGRYDSNRGFNPIQFVNDADTAADRMKDITRGLHDPNVLRVIGSMSKVMDALSDQSKRSSAASLRDLVSLVNELAANSVLE